MSKSLSRICARAMKAAVLRTMAAELNQFAREADALHSLANEHLCDAEDIREIIEHEADKLDNRADRLESPNGAQR